MRRHAVALQEAISREVRERRARSPAGAGETVLDMLLAAGEDGDRLDETEIRDHVLTLLFAGHDTTAATVSWMFMLLGQHPHVMRRLQHEIDAALPDRDATADDLLNGLPFLDQVIKETLRLYPAAWFGPRRARKDFNMYGHKIPAGTHVAYSSWLTHRLPHLWPDPDAFEPERFAPERARQISAGAYVPFGRGPRTCIGMRFGELEVKAIAATMLRRWHLELFPGQDFRARTIPTISPRDGVKAFVRARGSVDARDVPSAERVAAASAAATAAAAQCPVPHGGARRT
jgi:cytochrome P450